MKTYRNFSIIIFLLALFSFPSISKAEQIKILNLELTLPQITAIKLNVNGQEFFIAKQGKSASTLEEEINAKLNALKCEIVVCEVLTQYCKDGNCSDPSNVVTISPKVSLRSPIMEKIEKPPNLFRRVGNWFSGLFRQPPPPPACGDGICQTGEFLETCATCEADCGPCITPPIGPAPISISGIAVPLDGRKPTEATSSQLGKISLEDVSYFGNNKNNFLDPTAYAVGLEGVIIKTENAGQKWLTLVSPDKNKEDLFGVDRCIGDEKKAIAVGENGTILKTSSGSSFAADARIEDESGKLVSIKETLRDVSYAKLSDRECTHVSAVGDGGVVLHSHNGGGVWTKYSSPVNLTLRGVQQISKDALIVGDNGALLYLNPPAITDLSSTFSSMAGYSLDDISLIKFIDKNNKEILRGTVVGNKSTTSSAFAIEKAAGTWKTIYKKDFKTKLYDTAQTSKDRATIGGGITVGVAYSTTNGGSTWSRMLSQLKAVS